MALGQVQGATVQTEAWGLRAAEEGTFWRRESLVEYLIKDVGGDLFLALLQICENTGKE